MAVLGAELLECIDQNHIALCGFCEGYLCLEHQERCSLCGKDGELESGLICRRFHVRRALGSRGLTFI